MFFDGSHVLGVLRVSTITTFLFALLALFPFFSWHYDDKIKGHA